MKNHISKLIALGLLFIYTALTLIRAYSHPRLVVGLVSLSFLALVLFFDAKKTFSSRLGWLAIGVVLIGTILPNADELVLQYEGILNMLPSIVWGVLESETTALFGILFFLSQLFLRKRNHAFFILLRYAIALMFLLSIAQALFYDIKVFTIPVCVVLVLSLLCELKGSIEKQVRPSMLRCIMLTLVFYLVHFFPGGYIAPKIGELFTVVGDGWFRTILLVGVTAALILLDNYCRFSQDSEVLYISRNYGWSMLIWCLVLLVMNVWPAVMNLPVLLIAFPIVWLLCDVLMLSFENRAEIGRGTLFMWCWGTAMMFLLTLAKALNTESLLAETMILLLVTCIICWGVIGRRTVKKGLINGALGVMVVLLLVSSRLSSLEMVSPMLLLKTVICALMWCLFCAHTGKQNGRASPDYSSEFSMLLNAERIMPLAVLGIVLVRVLFFT